MKRSSAFRGRKREFGVDGSQRLTLNGVDGATGRYLIEPVSAEEISARAADLVLALGQDHVKELRSWHRRSAEAFLGPREGIDAKDLAQAGWGVIFSRDADPRIKEALRPLLDHRRAQASRLTERRYREFVGDRGYLLGESKWQFLKRQEAGRGPADPDKVPYYLLIVGSPEAVPYTFQYGLDVQYAVGRICFDRVEDYASYADGVVAAETRAATRSPRVTLFAPSNPDDPATALSAAELVFPLAGQLAKDRTGWETHALLGEVATKAQLARAIGGGDPGPALLFSATHGVAYTSGDPRQLRKQGALLCQEWPGPERSGGPLDEAWYFSADDLGADAHVAGLISFHFACFGAGTPRWDDFAWRGDTGPGQLAPHAFVAALPQRLLSHPNGGALAVIGHVDRAWDCSFIETGAGRQTEVYASCMKHLLSGNPIGSAFEYFNQRYAEMSTELADALDDVKYGKLPDHRALAGMWMAHHDARNFVILGDPAVRLVAAPVTGAGASAGPEVVTIATHTPVEPQTEPEQDLEPAMIDFGVREGLRQARERLVSVLQSLTESLGGVLERAVDNVTVLNVATYSSDDLAAATWDTATRQFTGATLRAVSRIAIDGDTQLLVGESPSDVDAVVWTVHLGMVEQARLARAELLKTVSSAFAGLLDAAKAW